MTKKDKRKTKKFKVLSLPFNGRDGFIRSNSRDCSVTDRAELYPALLIQGG